MHATPCRQQMLTPDAAEVGVVSNEIRELAALLYQVGAGEARDFALEVTNPKELRQHVPRVMEAEGLIEIRYKQIMSGHDGSSWSGLRPVASQSPCFAPLRWAALPDE